MKKRIIIPLTIIVIILTLVILSITIKSVNWDVDEISEVDSTTELARLISLHPDKFWNASVSEIFNRNTRKRHNGTHGLDGNEKESPAEYVDIYYHTAACIFHDQTNRNGDGYAHKITNIIEIESPGIIKVYKWTGDNKSPSYESTTLDFTTEGSARAIFDKMKKEKIIDSSVEFNYDNIKKDITAFAYLINETTQNAQKAQPIASKSYAYTNTKNAIHYFWKQPGGTIAIRKYAKASGMLDSYYYNAQGQNDEVTAEATQKRQEALKAASSVIEPATIEKLSTSLESQALTISYVGEKAYIGPLKVKYTGGKPIVKINVGTSNENWITTNEWATFDLAKKTFNNIQTGYVTSGQEFYAVTDKTNVESLSSIKVKLELEYKKYSAKLALTTSRTNDSQNLMFYMGKQEEKVLSVDWQGEISKKIEIQKQDENGNILKQSGIKFEVCSEDGTLIGTLTTENDGKTNAIELIPNTVYIIKETGNNAYGYKNASITDASITGGTITEKTAEYIKVKITDNAMLAVKNTPELGKLTIKKVDENGNPLPGVEFVIWQTYKGYLSIEDQALHTTSSEGTDMKAMYESDKIVYPVGDTSDEKLSKATRYITNNEGEIVLNNLEIYHSKDTKYEYIIREMSNPNYGYKGMVMNDENLVLTEADGSDIQGAIVEDMYSGDDITDGGKDALRKKVQFTIGRDTTVTVSNTSKLGNLVVDKQGQNKKLENVEFTLYKAVSENTGYIRLIKDSQFVSTINTEIDITDYEVNYAETAEEATIFKTDKDGKIIINNLEIYSGIDENYNPVKYDYWITERANNEYGYKNMAIDGVTIDGGNIIETDLEAREVQFTLDETKTTVNLIIKNLIEVSNLEIEKVTKPVGNLNIDSNPLEKVEFVIERVNGDYILLKNSNGREVKKINEIATINLDENFEATEYSIEYVNSKEIATRFVTGKDGKIIINNLEVYSAQTEKYSYKAHEVANNNYGYGSVENDNLTGTITELKLDENNTIKLENVKHLGKLSIIKNDEYSEKMVLANVGFVVEQVSEIRGSIIGKYAYLALYDEEGKFQPSIIGEATVNRNNKAKIVKNQKEYEVRYYYTELPYEKLSNEQKAQITTFITDENGNISIENLEVYSPLLRDASITQDSEVNKYTYRLVETTNKNTGFELSEVVELKFKVDSENEVTGNVANKQTAIKISGYVWIENTSGKSSEYDLKYTENNEDIKLIDLYKEIDGQLVKNPEAKVPVQIMLRDKLTQKIIKIQPDEFDETGKYTFIGVETDQLENYEVVFVYDGVYYTTIIPNLTENNGSKAKELDNKRKELNDKFGKVKYGNEVVATDGTVNTLEYTKNGRASYVSKFNFDTTVEANTSAVNINLLEEYTNLKDALLESLQEGETTNKTVEVIDNINVGLVLRNQAELTIDSSIYSVEVEVNDYKHTYYYPGRQQHYENVNADEVGVRFEEDSTPRYTQTVYSSDVEALENGSATMNVDITYVVSITNNETTLNSVVHEIENYFDSECAIQQVGLGLGENNEIIDIVDIIGTTESVPVEYEEGLQNEGRTYKSARIQLGGTGMTLNKKETKKIYIKFRVSQQAIKDLLQGKSTYHNATEIMSYSTYYNETTGNGKVNNEEFGQQTMNVTTERGEVGEIYASINRNTNPGNIKLILQKYSENSVETPILNTKEFEPDETSAASLILEATEARTMDGIIWEDKPTAESLDKNERLGDGIYDENTEKPIQNVLVSLRVINEEDGSIGGVAKYSDNKTLAITETDENGKYTFGYYDEEKDEYVGILPARYIIEYTYGKYLQGEKEKESYIVGKEIVNPIDYKSTIIVSEELKNAFENAGNDKWFAREDNAVRYSNVVDNVSERPEYNESTNEQFMKGTIKYNTANAYLSSKNMNARTPVMNIGVEYTETNETNILETQRITNLGNVDFGIIERPLVYMEVKKEITGMEIVANNGAAIIPMGDPSDLNSKMQYVKKLDSNVTAEIETKLLQGATLNLEYTITLNNMSNNDYYELEYYYYGTGGKTSTEIKPLKVVDYLQDTMVFDENKNQEGTWTKGTGENLDSDGYIADYVLEDVNKNKWKVFTTDAFKDIGAKQTGKVKMYATRTLSASDYIFEENNTEIIEIKGTRTVKGAWPGNYQPSAKPNEPDESEITVAAIAPTGITINYSLYIVTAVITLAVIGISILIIKKKVIK